MRYKVIKGLRYKEIGSLGTDQFEGLKNNEFEKLRNQSMADLALERPGTLIRKINDFNPTLRFSAWRARARSGGLGFRAKGLGAHKNARVCNCAVGALRYC